MTTPRANPQMPEPFFTARVHRPALSPSLHGACVGYEAGVWRASQLSDHLVEWLPEFALTSAEWTTMHHANSIALIRQAARTVYQSKKFENRGEFGELILHALIRQEFGSLPAISKIFYKTSTNDTVKGFDAVHVVGPPEALELWLGEAKFYNNISRAIQDVTTELEEHLAADYLRTEFMLIKGKLDPTWPHFAKLNQLLSPNTSLDQVFQRVCIPILLTYDSQCVASHTACTDAYIAEFEAEVLRHQSSLATKLAGKTLPSELRFHLFLVPLHDKAALVAALDGKLKLWQQL